MQGRSAQLVSSPALVSSPVVSTELYEKLREIARQFAAHERPGHSLPATALVHEAYLRLARVPGLHAAENPSILALAARIIRNVLVDHARSRAAARSRDRDWEEARQAVPAAVAADDILALHEALDQLTRVAPRQAAVVELRHFGGIDDATIGKILGLHERTVRDEWSIARAWLRARLNPPASATRSTERAG